MPDAPPICLDAPYADPDGDINDDSAINVLDGQLSVNIFLGIETNATLIGRADTRVCNTGYITTQTIRTVINIFLVGWS